MEICCWLFVQGDVCVLGTCGQVLVSHMDNYLVHSLGNIRNITTQDLSEACARYSCQAWKSIGAQCGSGTPWTRDSRSLSPACCDGRLCETCLVSPRGIQEVDPSPPRQKSTTFLAFPARRHPFHSVSVSKLTIASSTSFRSKAPQGWLLELHLILPRLPA